MRSARGASASSRAPAVALDTAYIWYVGRQTIAWSPRPIASAPHISRTSSQPAPGTTCVQSNPAKRPIASRSGRYVASGYEHDGSRATSAAICGQAAGDSGRVFMSNRDTGPSGTSSCHRYGAGRAISGRT